MTLQEILNELGYTHDWLMCGVVDEAFLRKQYAEYCMSEDKNQEHYRCGAFAQFLARQSTFSDELVDRLFSLTDAGPDGCDLRDDRIMRVIASGVLGDAQHWELCKRHPRVLKDPIQRRYLRESLRRKLRKEGIAATFAEIQQCSDSHIQIELLDHAQLTRSHLQWLASSGANKAIRNRAAQLLKSRRFS